MLISPTFKFLLKLILDPKNPHISPHTPSHTQTPYTHIDYTSAHTHLQIYTHREKQTYTYNIYRYTQIHIQHTYTIICKYRHIYKHTQREMQTYIYSIYIQHKQIHIHTYHIYIHTHIKTYTHITYRYTHSHKRIHIVQTHTPSPFSLSKSTKYSTSL